MGCLIELCGPLFVEDLANSLLAAKRAGSPVPQDGASWLGGISDALYEKLARVGLVEPRQKATVGQWVQKWLDNKRAQGYKGASLIAWGQVGKELSRLCGDVPLVEAGDIAERYRDAMQARGLRSTTIQKRLQNARCLFTDAVRAGLLEKNPFEPIRVRGGDVSERRVSIPVETIKQVIAAASNAQWRLSIALVRFGGLRIPAEAFSRRWADILWDQNRITLPSPKTQGAGKPYRVIPLFALLRPYLEEGWTLAEEGDKFILPED